MNELSLQINEALLNRGAALVSFADLDGIAEDIRHSLPFGISIAVALEPAIIANIRTGPTPEYYGEYKRTNALLSKLGHYAAKMLKDYGYQAIPKEPTTDFYDPKTLSVPLSHKIAATRAGLGWIGKCALLVTKKYGSAIRLTTVLTDAELEAGTPVEVSSCKDCMLCVELCPGNAPLGGNWDVARHRDSFFQPVACEKTCKELSAKAGIDTEICGICIAVCPWTIKYLNRKDSA